MAETKRIPIQYYGFETNPEVAFIVSLPIDATIGELIEASCTKWSLAPPANYVLLHPDGTEYLDNLAEVKNLPLDDGAGQRIVYFLTLRGGVAPGKYKNFPEAKNVFLPFSSFSWKSRRAVSVT